MSNVCLNRPLMIKIMLKCTIATNQEEAKKAKGEWGMGNGEWGMGSGECGVGSGEWGVGKYMLFPTPHSPFTLSITLNLQQNNHVCFHRRCRSGDGQPRPALLSRAFVHGSGRPCRGHNISFDLSVHSLRLNDGRAQSFISVFEQELVFADLLDLLVGVQQRRDSAGLPGLNVVPHHEIAGGGEEKVSRKSLHAKIIFVSRRRFASHVSEMRIEARFGNPNLIEPVVWNVIEYVVPLALSRLPRAVDLDRVVLFGHRQSRVARVAGQIFSPGVDDEAVGVWVSMPR